MGLISGRYNHAEIHLNKLALEAKKIYPEIDANLEIGFWEVSVTLTGNNLSILLGKCINFVA